MILSRKAAKELLNILDRIDQEGDLLRFTGLNQLRTMHTFMESIAPADEKGVATVEVGQACYDVFAPKILKWAVDNPKPVKPKPSV